MNILLLNHYAGSIRHGMEFRPYYLSREWVGAGHRVRIVAASHSHLRARQPDVPGTQAFEVVDGIEYQWFRAPEYSGNGVARALNIFAFSTRLLAQARRIAEEFRPDTVIASSTHPFDIFGARRIARLAKARLVFEVHDLWPLTLMELAGMSRFHPFIMALAEAERISYLDADVVVSLLPTAKEYMVSRGMAPDKFVAVPNGVNVVEWEAEARASRSIPHDHAKRLEALRAASKFVVGYAGGHGLSNALDNLLEAAALVDDDMIHFVLVGRGPEKARLAELARRRSLSNVTFLDSVPKASIPELLSRFDALFIGFQDRSLYRFGVSPNKLIDYLMAGRPVVQALTGGYDLVRIAGCGRSVPAENPQALAAAIKELRRTAPESLAEMGRRGRGFALANHDYRNLATRFLNAVSDDPKGEESFAVGSSGGER